MNENLYRAMGLLGQAPAAANAEKPYAAARRARPGRKHGPATAETNRLYESSQCPIQVHLGTMSAMSDSDDWAIAVSMNATFDGHRGTTARDDVRILAERLPGNVMLHGPTETFSQLMPTYSPPPEDDGLTPYR
jgi:hypothetical protein